MKSSIRNFLALLIMFSALTVKGQEEIKDFDGNIYKTIKVGNQVWMAENLRSTHFRDGQAVPVVKEDKQWDALSNGAYCDVANNPSRAEGQGRLYNWYVIADARNICPPGWHVPTEAEWQILVNYLSKAKGAKALNTNLFKVLQEDFRGYDGGFSGNGYGGGGWWTSTEATGETAYYHGVNYDTASKNRLEGRKRFGYSIRCIKD